MNAVHQPVAGNSFERSVDQEDELMASSSKISHLIKNYEQISVQNSKDNGKDELMDDISVRSGRSALSSLSARSTQPIVTRRSPKIAKYPPSNPPSVLPKSVISHSRIENSISNVSYDSVKSDTELRKVRSNSKGIIIPKAFRANPARSMYEETKTKEERVRTTSQENAVHTEESTKEEIHQAQRLLPMRPKADDHQKSNFRYLELQHTNQEKEFRSKKVIKEEELSKVQAPVRPRGRQKSPITPQEYKYIRKTEDKKVRVDKLERPQEFSLHEKETIIFAESRTNGKESRESSNEQTTFEVNAERDGETTPNDPIEEEERFGQKVLSDLQKSLSKGFLCGIDPTFLEASNVHNSDDGVIRVDKGEKSANDTPAPKTVCENSGVRTTMSSSGSKHFLSPELSSEGKESRESTSKPFTQETKRYRVEGRNAVENDNKTKESRECASKETTGGTMPQQDAGIDSTTDANKNEDYFGQEFLCELQKSIPESATVINGLLGRGDSSSGEKSNTKDKEVGGIDAALLKLSSQYVSFQDINDEPANTTNTENNSGKMVMEWLQNKQKQQEEWNLLSWNGLPDTKETEQQHKPQNLEDKDPSREDKLIIDQTATEQIRNKHNNDDNWHPQTTQWYEDFETKDSSEQNRAFDRIHIQNKEKGDGGDQNNNGNAPLLVNERSKSNEAFGPSGFRGNNLEDMFGNGDDENSSSSNFGSNCSSNKHDLFGIIPEILADSVDLYSTKEKHETKKRSNENSAHQNCRKTKKVKATTNTTISMNTLTKYKATDYGSCAWMYYY